MCKIIHHLRKKPEEIRRSMLHIFMFLIILIMFGLWVLSLRSAFSDKDIKLKLKQNLEPFSVLKDNIVKDANGAE